MAHLVLGYPTLEESLRTAEIYVEAGVEILELQIPFSHPTADGPVITAACREAVDQGVTVLDCMNALGRLRKRYPGQEILVMSYLNRVYTYGFERFLRELDALQIQRIIIPDLPVDSPTATRAFPKRNLVPVLAANVSDKRLDRFLDDGYNFFYLMSDFKITGSAFSLHPRLQEIALRIRAANPDNRIGIGFGINTPEQVLAVLEVADYAIIGSALIQAQQKGELESFLKNISRVTTLAT